MVTLEEAYEIIKKLSETPIGILTEKKDCYKGAEVSVNKESGEIRKIGSIIESIMEPGKEWILFYKKMFSDYMDYYRENKSERSLAGLYAYAWNELCYGKEREQTLYKSKEERRRILVAWSDIEENLYLDIRKIMDKDQSIVYPPCVLKKFDDPFYRIKPFMIRNGWSDCMSTKTWI